VMALTADAGITPTLALALSSRRHRASPIHSVGGSRSNHLVHSSRGILITRMTSSFVSMFDLLQPSTLSAPSIVAATGVPAHWLPANIADADASSGTKPLGMELELSCVQITSPGRALA